MKRGGQRRGIISSIIINLMEYICHLRVTSDFNLLPWPTTPEFVPALIKIKSLFAKILV